MFLSQTKIRSGKYVRSYTYTCMYVLYGNIGNFAELLFTVTKCTSDTHTHTHTHVSTHPIFEYMQN